VLLVYGTLIDDAKPEPLVKETSKAAGAVTVILPDAGERLAPDKEYVFSGDVVLTTTLPNDKVAGLTERTGLLVGVALAAKLCTLSNLALSNAVTRKKYFVPLVIPVIVLVVSETVAEDESLSKTAFESVPI
jgi:hypothetical protein